jgi:hypothetical protein
MGAVSLFITMLPVMGLSGAAVWGLHATQHSITQYDNSQALSLDMTDNQHQSRMRQDGLYSWHESV